MVQGEWALNDFETLVILKYDSKWCLIGILVVWFCYRKGERGNPFEEEEWDEYSNNEGALVDRGEPGIPVKALYDYEGAEDDELSFKQGIVDKYANKHDN